MKKLVALLLMGTIVAKSNATMFFGTIGGPATDGEYFQKKEYSHEQDVEMSFVVHRSWRSLRQSAIEHKIPHASTVKAFSIIKAADTKVCQVHFLDPAVEYMPEYLGHEITHCLYGRFHK